MWTQSDIPITYCDNKTTGLLWKKWLWLCLDDTIVYPRGGNNEQEETLEFS